MKPLDCNYQRRISANGDAPVRPDRVCQHCGAPAADLERTGGRLEVCADEFASDIVTGERLLTPITLCPECHRAHHLDRRRIHTPCQIQARYSREGAL